MLSHAIELDPAYALAYTGIADYYNWLGVFGIRPFAECSAAAKEHWQSRRSGSTAAEAYSALGLPCEPDLDWAVAEGSTGGLSRSIQIMLRALVRLSPGMVDV